MEKAMRILALLLLAWLAPAADHSLSPLARPGEGDRVPSKLKHDLRSRWEKDRARAVRKLADLGSQEAWGVGARGFGGCQGAGGGRGPGATCQAGLPG